MNCLCDKFQARISLLSIMHLFLILQSPQILADQADTESLVDDVFFDLKSPSIGVPSPEMHRKEMGTPTTPLPTVTEVPEGTDEVDRG